MECTSVQGTVLKLSVIPFRCLCSASAPLQAMGPPLKHGQADSRLERDVVSAVLHLREHGWAIMDDVITRYARLKGHSLDACNVSASRGYTVGTV